VINLDDQAQEQAVQPTSDPIAAAPAPAVPAPAANAPAAQAMDIASPFPRLVAAIIDGIILGIAGAVIGAVTSTGSPFSGGASNFSLFNAQTVISTLIGWAYNIGLLIYSGATIGKMAMGIKVVSAKGEALTPTQIVLRETVGKLVSTYALLLGYIWILFDNKRQGWHDKIAGTLVVKK